MSTQRSVREFSADPVPDDLVKRVLELAMKAPNGTNRQAWRFIVIRDAEQRGKVADLYVGSLKQSFGAQDLNEALARPDIVPMLKGGIRMAQNLHHAPPVFILVCFMTQEGYDPGPSIFPAVQNLSLAAWGFGLGTILTTALHRRKDRELRELLGIPPEILIGAFIPMGYPARPYGPPKRRPVEEVAFFERWGSPARWD